VVNPNINNDTSFREKHPGVLDGSDCSDGTSYPLTENHTLPVAQAMGRVAFVPPLLCGDVYAPSERHVCYTLRMDCSYGVAVYTKPGDVYAFLRPIATCCTLIYVQLGDCHVLQYSLRFGYIACRCISFASIVFYMSEIYCQIITLSSTMSSVLHILH